MQPAEVNSRNLIDGRISVSFSNYKAGSSSRPLKYNDKDEEIQSDEDTVQTLAVLIERDNGVLEEVDIPTNPKIEGTNHPYLLIWNFLHPHGMMNHKKSPLVMDILLPKERQTILTLTHERKHFQRSSEEDHAGATSPGATVLRSMDTTQDDSNYDFFHQIQYMVSLTQPMMFEEDFINPFASEGGGNELIVTGYEMDYPSLQRLVESPQEQMYSSSTVISPYNPPQEATMDSKMTEPLFLVAIDAKRGTKNMLDELQEHVESIDMANDLHSIGDLLPLLGYLKNSDAGIRAKAADVVTTIVQNNPRSQQLVMEASSLESLLSNFISDPDLTVRTKALSAISSLIRNNKAGIYAFLIANDYAGLRNLCIPYFLCAYLDDLVNQ
ncbi:hypothetical protein ZIOFF_016556 [Zingiber officinale]|uniref:Uncharacterized protein n=1 Tax=Zingiber officinale TaxID=94328 RepID=A0A8J5HLL5_ZINOF|nr:hypothetical protein ZIOFF_016556 [Zingiber officinale]